MIFKFLDKDFNQLPWGVDITNELSSINITNTLANGSSIELKAPVTQNVRVWIDEIRKTFLNNTTGDDFVVIADTSNIQNYFIVDSLDIVEDKTKGNSEITIIGYSADKLLSTRIASKKDYSGTLTSTLEDIISGVGLGGVLNETYPYSISTEDRTKRFVPSITLSIDISESGTVELSTTNTDALSFVSDLLNSYGKRMYSYFDELTKKLVIKIEDGTDKTISSTGLKNLISSENNSITEYGYQIDRNERVNFLYATDGTGNLTPFDGESENNLTSGINRREGSLSQSESNSIEGEASRELEASRDALEKINVKGEFSEGFNYGIDGDSVFVGDKVSFSLYDMEGNRYVIDDYLTEMNIIIDTTKTGSPVPVYMPTIGFSDKDDEGQYVSRRQKLVIKSNKNNLNLEYKI